jgi:hypothetical protein
MWLKWWHTEICKGKSVYLLLRKTDRCNRVSFCSHIHHTGLCSRSSSFFGENWDKANFFETLAATAGLGHIVFLGTKCDPKTYIGKMGGERMLQ